MERLLTEREALEYLRISRRHLFQLRERGAIPFIKLGRRVLYPGESLRQWVEQKLQEVREQQAKKRKAAG